GEFNTDFHPMVDFIAASPLRYALTIKPTVFVSHIRQFWSTARTETIDEGTYILATVDDEHVSPVRDDSQGEACPTDSDFIADQDRATIAKSFTLPRDSAPRVTSPAAEEGSMQQTLNELTAFCTSLQRQHLELLAKFQAQGVEINRLKERVKILEDKEGVIGDKSGNDAPIKGRKQQEREDIRMNEQIARDVEVARIHAEEEIQGMIYSLDKSNETVAKYLQEYQQFASELSLEK
nr:hypothetical protein [Tanacetum cinerariifolium]